MTLWYRGNRNNGRFIWGHTAEETYFRKNLDFKFILTIFLSLISHPFRDRKEKASCIIAELPPLFTQEKSQSLWAPMPVGNSESDEIKKYLAFCWNHIFGYQSCVLLFLPTQTTPRFFSFFPQTSASFFASMVSFHSYGGPRWQAALTPILWMKKLRLREIQHVARRWILVCLTSEPRLLIFRPRCLPATCPHLYFSVQWDEDLGVFWNGMAKQDSCGFQSPWIWALPSPTKPLLFLYTYPSGTCFWSQGSRQRRTELFASKGTTGRVSEDLALNLLGPPSCPLAGLLISLDLIWYASKIW